MIKKIYPRDKRKENRIKIYKTSNNTIKSMMLGRSIRYKTKSNK
jgi:hypothetical protein